MKSFRWVLFALMTVASLVAQPSPRQSQSASAAAGSQALEQQRTAPEVGLILELRPRDRDRPGDVNLSVRFVNHGGITLRMPKPLTECYSADGYIKITRELLEPAKYPERGSACVADSLGKRDLPAETSRWVKLAPRGAYEIHTEMAFNNPGAKYKIQAKYIPAELTDEELRVLNENGISALQQSAESKSLVLRSPNPK